MCVYVFVYVSQTLILQGVGTHINSKDNAEKLRSKFVYHEGKKVLEIWRDEFVLGQPVNDWAGNHPYNHIIYIPN